MANETMSEATRSLIEEAVTHAVDATGDTETVEIRFHKQFGKLNLTVFIWSAGGVDLDKCERVHNAVSDALDACEELFPSDYVLNVSSPGLDRPIVTDDDFRRAMGTEIEMAGADTRLRGTLTAYDAETFTLVTGGKQNETQIISRDIKARIQPYIGF